MGRRMRALDPDAGIAERFACELRALRAVAGEPPFWKMARRCDVSKSALAAAVDGRALPSENVTREFVRVCGGDWQWWRERLRQVRDQVNSSRAEDERSTVEAVGEPDPSLAPVLMRRVLPAPTTAFWPVTAGGRPLSREGDTDRDGQGGPETLRSLRKRARIISGLAVLQMATIVALLIYVFAPSNSAPIAVEDGTDPKVSHCDSDARTLDSSAVVLISPGRIDGRTLPIGSSVGTVSLRFSSRCNGAWARFDPADGVFGNPDQGTVTIQAGRPAEGAQSSFRLGHIDQTYSDLLLTGMGCVVASATLNVGQATATGSTRCRPPM
ncbi:DUF2690 domain-containing protein [Catenulispora subtropica]|uniref:DUF2690 domain-containing protein n=1 Tax=Catenulispora subtropica TaxID=450798 RepID=A0ABN2R2A1_9ACTN